MSGSKKPLSKSPTGNLEATSKPKLCTKNCGFFGHPNFGGQCSRCYGEEQKSSRASSSSTSTSASAAAATSIAAKSSSADSASSSSAVGTFGTPRTSGVGGAGTPLSVSWDLTPPEKSSNSSSRGTPFPRPPTPYRSSSSRTGTGSGSGSNKTKRSFSSSSTLKVTTTSTSSSFTTSSSSQASLKSNGSKRQKMVVKVKEEEVKKEFMASSKVRSAKEEIEGEGKKGAKKAKKSRCQQCGTSIEVIGFDCRCGSRFCVVHRHSAGHGCTYDYRAAGQSELRKANPKVVADKVRKI